MWLLPYLSAVSGAAVRLYYRASLSGAAVPRDGPVLLVGNHPNSLLDPAFMAWAAGRPVRFLAKAPLFTDARVGWLIRGSGSLPVYRRQDDASLVGRNDDTFRAVFDALAAGSAVAIFPEGTSHSEPGLAPLKTGAARIALGAAQVLGRSFPVVPVGLVFRAKDRFRSEAHVVVGAPVEWDDIARSLEADAAAVRTLTARIEQAIRAVTLNLARWEDEPVVRAAEAIWAVERGAERTPEARFGRLGRATDALAHLRASGDVRWSELAADVEDHARMLRALGVRAEDVHLETDLTGAARWALGRLRLVGLVLFALAAVAVTLFWLPYRLTGVIASRMTSSRDTTSTYHVLGGALVFLVWIASLTGIVWAVAGWRLALCAFVALPAVAVTGLAAVERWRRTLLQARRWLILRRHDTSLASLRARQQELAHRLDDALAAHEAIR